MLADALNSSLYPDWLDYIKTVDTKDAFRYLVGLTAGLRTYQCHPGLHGEYRDYRLFDLHGEHHFAVGIAQKWLLFYFRPPVIRTGRYSFEEVAVQFPTAKQVESEIWTVQLEDIDDVRQLFGFLQLT